MSPFKFILRLTLTIALLWILNTYASQYVQMKGGTAAYLVIGAVLTILNMIVRPVLNVLAFPLKLFATLLALIIANTAFLWIAQYVLVLLAPPTVALIVPTGLSGYIIAALLLGFGNWVIKEIL